MNILKKSLKREKVAVLLNEHYVIIKIQLNCNELLSVTKGEVQYVCLNPKSKSKIAAKACCCQGENALRFSSYSHVVITILYLINRQDVNINIDYLADTTFYHKY